MVGKSREDLCQTLDVISFDHQQESSSQNNYYHNDDHHHLLNVEDSRQPSVLQDEEKEEEEEFSFVCTNPSSGSLIFAEDIFQNGQIRPIDYVPLLNEDNNLIKSTAQDVTTEVKASSTSPPVMFVEDRSITEGPSCVWTGSGRKASQNQQLICKKGNFTRFSKLTRFREFFLRSNVHSQLGKDAFIFFNRKYYSSKYQTTIKTTTCKSVVDQEKEKDNLVEVKGNRGEQYNGVVVNTPTAFLSKK